MAEWVQLDVRDANKETPQEINGVKVKVSISPYDVPRKVRGYPEKDSSFFVIEFEYLLSGEPTRPVRETKHPEIHLEVGVHSQRIYKIKLDVVKLKCQAVRLEVEPIVANVVGSIEAFSATVTDKLRGRYKATENAVLNYRNDLLSSLVPGSSQRIAPTTSPEI